MKNAWWIIVTGAFKGIWATAHIPAQKTKFADLFSLPYATNQGM